MCIRDSFTNTEELSYKDIPNFPVSTVAGHKGALLAGKLGDTEVYACLLYTSAEGRVKTAEKRFA